MAKKSTHGLKVRPHISPNGKKVYVPEGADPEPMLKTCTTKYLFSNKLADQIIQYYMEGKSIVEISKLPDMPPPNIVYYWMQRRKDFKARMTLARETRGFYFEEKALEAAEDAKGTSSEEVAAQRLKTETYKWAAEVNNRAIFGKQTKLVGDPDQPIGFIIETGIRREPIPVPSTPADPPLPTPPGDPEEPSNG